RSPTTRTQGNDSFAPGGSRSGSGSCSPRARSRSSMRVTSTLLDTEARPHCPSLPEVHRDAEAALPFVGVSAKAVANADVQLHARRGLPGHADATHAAVADPGEMLRLQLHEQAHRGRKRPGRVDRQQATVGLAIHGLEVEPRCAIL